MLPTDIEPEHIAELEDIRLFLVNVHDKSPVTIWFSDKIETKIITENMDLAGDLIHSIANFLNIEDLKVINTFYNNEMEQLFKLSTIFLDDSLFSKHHQPFESVL